MNKDEGISPAVPEPAEPDPEKAIGSAEAWAPVRAGKHGELVPEGQILQDEVSTGSEGSVERRRKGGEGLEHHLESAQE